ncbi:MAG: ABC transporter substrate-binding protein [Desulfobacteraceae bacterium]|nr:ABC transporter substrate-binding protein [Desulfobacteraceae bacterium]
MSDRFRILIICLVFSAAAGSAAAAGGEMALVGDSAIRDCAGRQVRAGRPFSRIISLYGAHTENLFSLGLDDEVIGVSRNCDHPAAARQKDEFSARDGPERFLAAKPDLVLVRPMLDRGYAKLMDRLSDFGIRVVSLQPGTIREMKTYWRILGRLTGHPVAAREMINRFENGVLQAKQISGQIREKKHVFFESIHDRFKTFSPGAMPLFALKCAGGRNVAADARPVRNTNIAAYGKEQILAKGERIEVYLAQQGTMNPVTTAKIRREPGFGVIRAVRNDAVYTVTEEIVSRPTLRLLQGICRIGELLYPETFTRSVQQRILHPDARKTNP